MPRTLQEKVNLILEATIASLEPNLSWQDLDAQYQNQARKRKKFRKALYAVGVPYGTHSGLAQ